jgi:hypothetical protein
MKLSASWVRFLVNIYPPYVGAGVRVKELSNDFRKIQVEMKLRWWNRNYVGTQFGGSLYSMTDPFLMFMFLHNLGSENIVWDKAAKIRYRKPGRGTVRANFHLSEEQLQSIIQEAQTQPKVEPIFQVQVVDDSNEVVAEIEKTLYIKRKETNRS